MTIPEKFAKECRWIHIRPGMDSRGTPVGTVAVTVKSGSLRRVGFAVLNAKQDKWDSTTGITVACGRALHSKDSLFVECADDKQVLVEALEAVLYGIEERRFSVPRKFQKALFETWYRMKNADLDRQTGLFARKKKQPSKDPLAETKAKIAASRNGGDFYVNGRSHQTDRLLQELRQNRPDIG